MKFRSTSIVLALSLLAGCTSSNVLEYEREKAPTSITSNSFDEIWDASLDSLRDYHFEIDRHDRRAGVITTRPMTSSQFFEPWRNELKTVDAVAESSLASLRRTATITITRDQNRFTASPVVRVERLSQRGRRMTTSAQYTSAFRTTPERGSIESDQGIDLPGQYWYDVAQDDALATSISKQIAQRLK